MRNRSRGRRYVIDLSDVTFIDEMGKGLLSELGDEGAEFVARDVYTAYLLENLRSRGSTTSNKTLAPSQVMNPCNMFGYRTCDRTPDLCGRNEGGRNR